MEEGFNYFNTSKLEKVFGFFRKHPTVKSLRYNIDGIKNILANASMFFCFIIGKVRVVIRDVLIIWWYTH